MKHKQLFERIFVPIKIQNCTWVFSWLNKNISKSCFKFNEDHSRKYKKTCVFVYLFDIHFPNVCRFSCNLYFKEIGYMTSPSKIILCSCPEKWINAPAIRNNFVIIESQRLICNLPQEFKKSCYEFQEVLYENATQLGITLISSLKMVWTIKNYYQLY